MAVRDDFAAGEVLAAADLNDTFAAKLPYSYGTATPTATDDGFLWYDENDTPPTPKFWDGAAFQALTSGKILQIVRATSSTSTSTTSASYTDATGMSVTITPQKSTSALLILATFIGRIVGTNNNAEFRIADNSNNAVSGAEAGRLTISSSDVGAPLALLGYVTPATTSAVTYKLRLRVTGGGDTADVRNSVMTGQMFAIEVSA